MPDLVIDERRRSVYLDGHEIQLTPQEYRILHCLGRNGGQVVSKPELLAAMWPTTEAARGESLHFDPAAVDLVIFRLRQKLGDNAHTPNLYRDAPWLWLYPAPCANCSQSRLSIQ